MIVIAGFQLFSSSKIDRHTVPDGNTLGWNKGGVNLPRNVSITHYLHLGGLDGYSSGKYIFNLYTPPSHGVFASVFRTYVGFSGDTNFPHEQIQRPICFLFRTCIESLRIGTIAYVQRDGLYATAFFLLAVCGELCGTYLVRQMPDMTVASLWIPSFATMLPGPPLCHVPTP